MPPAALLTRFSATRPPYEVPQDRTLAWLASAHAEAEAALDHLDDGARDRFATKMARVIRRVACSSDKIARRGQSVGDVEQLRWESGELYDVRRHPRGRGSEVRTKLFAEIVNGYFEAEYAADTAPDAMIHVTCTGYVAPSGAQRVVARRGWRTAITHAYHMGCYAAIPAVRIASGFAATGATRVDIVHTELCSLHLDPSDHSLEQLVVQSLFGDGFIRYALVPDRGEEGLRVLAVHEQLLPDSAHAMTWIVGDAGMQMTLARDVPDRVARAVRGFVIELFARAGLDVARAKHAVFAVHPGGPKIIDQVRKVLELDEAQVAASRGVLYDYGNMSSATLPHIWQRVTADPRIPAGALVPSLAFGPGLTVCGALLEKR